MPAEKTRAFLVNTGMFRDLSLKALSRKYRSADDFRSAVDEYTVFLPPGATPLQRVWHYRNEDKEPRLCPMCGKPSKFVIIHHYRVTCGDRSCHAKYIQTVRTPPATYHKPSKETVAAMMQGLIDRAEGMSVDELRSMDGSALAKLAKRSDRLRGLIVSGREDITVPLAVHLFKTGDVQPMCACGNKITKLRVSTCGDKACVNSHRSKINIEKYGAAHISSSSHYLDIKKSRRLAKYSGLLDPDVILDNDGYYFECRCAICKGVYHTNQHLVRHRRISGITQCTECNPVGSFKDSSGVKEIRKVLDSHGIAHESNDRKVIRPYELDVLIPSKMVAIEFNGLFFHNDRVKSKDYHLMKTNMCASQGYKLIHVWSDDWMIRKGAVAGMILAKLGVFDRRLNARSCDVRAVDKNECADFLESNHVQGSCPSSVRVGLYSGDELVSVMTFGARRISLGAKSKKGSVELLRMCSLSGVAVRGGASKMLKWFERTHPEVSEIVSYSDNSRNTGGVYADLGFAKASDGDINYWYVDGSKTDVNCRRLHRFAFRKDVLVSQGFDPAKTEADIMVERGYYRVYDCGSSKWVKKMRADGIGPGINTP